MKLSSILPVLVAAIIGCSSGESQPEQSESVSQPLHAWADYHWFRTSNPLNLTLSSNLTPVWAPYLNTTSSDWNVSSVIETSIVQGSVNPKRCPPTLGRVEICNSAYGRNGWLGIAQIWVSSGHIKQAVVKLNDTYYKMSQYNNVGYRNMVMCQEVAHAFGLDHQDEVQTNTNLGSCMDYTNNPYGPPSNEHPNAHDYEQLEIIYSHLDTLATAELATESDPNHWGELASSVGHSETYVRNLGHGEMLVTHVFKAE